MVEETLAWMQVSCHLENSARETKRVRSLDPDVAGVEREGVAAFDAVPLDGLAPTLPSPVSEGGGCIALVRIESVNVLGSEPGTLVHSLGGWRALPPPAAASR